MFIRKLTKLSFFTVLLSLVSTTAAQCSDHQPRCTHWTFVWCSGTFSQLHLVSVECASKSSTVSSGIWYHQRLHWTPHKKSRWVKSSDRRDHAIGPPRPIYLCPKRRLRWLRMTPAKWGDAPSCRNQKHQRMSNDTSSKNSHNTCSRKIKYVWSISWGERK